MRMIFSFFKMLRPACDLGCALLHNPGFGLNNITAMLGCNRRLALPWRGPGITLCLFGKIKVLHIMKTTLSLVIVQSIIPVLVRQKYISLASSNTVKTTNSALRASSGCVGACSSISNYFKKTRLPQCPFWHLI